MECSEVHHPTNLIPDSIRCRWPHRFQRLMAYASLYPSNQACYVDMAEIAVFQFCLYVFVISRHCCHLSVCRLIRQDAAFVE